MADRCNISNYLLRDTNRKLAIPLPQTNVKKNSFFGAVLWNSLPIYIDQQQAKSLAVLRAGCNNSSGDLHGTYVKRTKAFSLLVFGL